MKTLPELFIIDILKGFAGAVNETAVQMSIRDMFFVNQRGTANGIYLAALTSGTTLSPMAAGAQATRFGWRSSYLSLASVMTVITLLFALAFEETKFVPPVHREGVHIAAHAAAGEKTSGSRHHFRGHGDVDDAAAGLDRVERAPTGMPPQRARFRYPRSMRLQLVTPTNESLWKTFYDPIHIWWFPHVLICSLLFGFGLALLLITASMKSGPS
ncbi:hypothetical protein CDD83_7452 [Cordyceps sp. RAO-2017]|nr:hypothetical protein CDD83_7452 [Cordyceps sp. RAO-2017]